MAGIDWKGIEEFIGFGRRNAPVVFVGMEEGLAKGQSLDRDLLHRSKFAPVMDLALACRGMPGTNLNAAQRTWRPMCDLMLRREGVSAPTLADRTRYQAQRLGRSDGDTLLVELLPYPHSRSSEWYEIYEQRYRSRDQYVTQMSKIRRELLRPILFEADRALVVCYGKENSDQYKQLLPTARWRLHREHPSFQVADLSRTRLVLSPHFSGRDFNSDQDLAAFASVCLELR